MIFDNIDMEKMNDYENRNEIFVISAEPRKCNLDVIRNFFSVHYLVIEIDNCSAIFFWKERGTNYVVRICEKIFNKHTELSEQISGIFEPFLVSEQDIMIKIGEESSASLREIPDIVM